MNSWLGIEGKSIIVTGGASGIGYATVQELLSDGAYVTVCDISEKAPEAEIITLPGGQPVYHCIFSVE